MTEAGISRILVASLHQAIADLLPTRLEFYENWLNPAGMRHGSIGLARLNAVLSFLRQEGAPYREVTWRAGEYAAEWSVLSEWAACRSLIRAMPLWLRSRVVMRAARRAIGGTALATRAKVRIRNGHASIDLRGSLFCNVRDASAEHLCGFYAALVSRFLGLYSVPGLVRLDQCRAVGDRSCLIDVTLDTRRPSRVTSLVTHE